MRKIEQDMIAAVQSCLDGSERTWRSGNTEVSTHHHGVAGTPGYERTVVVRLHDNVIAEFDSALNGDRGCRGLKLRDSGWQTNTTKSRLNALLGAFRASPGASRALLEASRELLGASRELLGSLWELAGSL